MSVTEQTSCQWKAEFTQTAERQFEKLVILAVRVDHRKEVYN